MVFNFIGNNAGFGLLNQGSVEIPFFIAALYFILIIKFFHFSFSHKERQSLPSIITRSIILGFLLYWPLAIFFILFSLGLYALRQETETSNKQETNTNKTFNKQEDEGTFLLGKDKSSDLFFTGSAAVLLLWRFMALTGLNDYFTNGVGSFLPFYAQSIIGLFVVILSLIFWRTETKMKPELTGLDSKWFVGIIIIVFFLNGADKAAAFLIGMFLLDLWFRYKDKHPDTNILGHFKKQSSNVAQTQSEKEAKKYDAGVQRLDTLFEKYNKVLTEKLSKALGSKEYFGNTREEISDHLRESDPQLTELHEEIEILKEGLHETVRGEKAARHEAAVAQKTEEGLLSVAKKTLNPKTQGIPNPLMFIGFLGLFAIFKLFEHYYGWHLYNTISRGNFSMVAFIVGVAMVIVKLLFVSFGRNMVGENSGIGKNLKNFLIVELIATALWWAFTLFGTFGILDVASIVLMVYPLALIIVISFFMTIFSGGLKAMMVTVGSLVFISFIIVFIMISQNIYPSLLFFETLRGLPEPQQVAADLDITVTEGNWIDFLGEWFKHLDPTYALEQQQIAKVEASPAERIRIKSITTNYNPKPVAGQLVQYSATLVSENLKKEECLLDPKSEDCLVKITCEFDGKPVDNKTMSKAELFGTQEVFCSFTYPNITEISKDRLKFKVETSFTATADVSISFTNIPPKTAKIPQALSTATNVNVNLITPPVPMLITQEGDKTLFGSSEKIKISMVTGLATSGKIVGLKNTGIMVPEFLKVLECHPFKFVLDKESKLGFTAPRGYQTYSIDQTTTEYKNRDSILGLPTRDKIAISCDLKLEKFDPDYVGNPYLIRGIIKYDFESSKTTTTGGITI